ncbi:MAG TPA: M56 family metallopeptidase [Candidatus Elarobacter sp.]|jgi:beta-lactamase regulating signal transducer with metallopeptidase domain
MTGFAPAGALESAALAIASYVLDSLWQGVLVVLLAAAAIRVFRSANATTRYAIWYLALIALIALPAITIGVLAIAQHRAAVSAEASAAAAAPLAGAIVAHSSAQPNTTMKTRSDLARVAPARPTPAEPVGPRFERPRIALPSAVSLVVAALWIAGALLGLVRIGIGYVALARLQRDALPLPPAYRDGMPLWEESTQRGGRETRLCVSSSVPVPVAVGLFDGMILMPDHLLSSFDRADVDRFSLHEMAHLQRRDDWTCAFERIACAVLFFNPAVRWIARQLDLEREVACDDWVVTQTREVRPYAVGLTKMAEATPWPHRPVPTPAIFASRKSISIRIERLLNKHRDVRPTVAGGPAAACGIAIVAVSLVLLPVAPVIGNAVTPAVTTVVAHPAQPPHGAKPAHARTAVVVAVKKAPAHRTTTAVLRPVVAKPIAATIVAKPRTAATRPAAGKVPKPRAVAVVPARHDVIEAHHAKQSAAHSTITSFSIGRISAAKASLTVSMTDSNGRPTTSHPTKFQYSFSASSSSPSTSVAPAPAPRVVAARVDLLEALNIAGYQKLSADEIIALHDNGVGGSLLIAASKYFDRRATVAEIVLLARSGVTSKYLDDLGQHGVKASPSDVVRFLQSGVSAGYAGTLQHAISGLSSAYIIELALHGVSSKLVTGLKERGYDVGAPAIIEFAQHGVPLSYVDAINAKRNPKFTLDEIVKLHERGVSANAL